MSEDRVFLDTNILVYTFDPSASEKRGIAQKALADLWDSGRGLISTQVLPEFYVTITKKVPRPAGSDVARAIIQDLL